MRGGTAPIPPRVKGNCPSLLDPMESGDGFLVRLKPRLAAFSAEDLRLIADQAARYGNGMLDLTNRANLQVRGLMLEDVEAFAEPLIKAGLAEANPALESIRNIQVDPLGVEDPHADIDSHAWAARLEAVLLGHEDAAQLPAKFGLSVEGRRDTLAPPAALRVSVTSLETVLVVFGRSDLALELPNAEHTLPTFISTLISNYVRYLDEIEFLKFDAWIERVGLEGAVPLRDFNAARVDLPKWPVAEQSLGLAETHTAYAVTLGAPLGQITTRQLESLADLAETFGDGCVRILRGKALMIAGVADHLLDRVIALGGEIGLMVSDADPRRRVVACPGQPYCGSAWINTHDLADRLTTQFPDQLPDRVHLSGCTKGCAHPETAALTLVGGEQGLGVLKGDRADGAPRAWIKAPEEVEIWL